MKEINITIQPEYIDFLYYIQENLKPRNVKIYSAVTELNDMAVFSLAAADEEFDKLTTKLKDLVADIVLFAYKEKYLRDSIDFKNLNDMYKQTLLKALVLFDSEDDKRHIKQHMKLDNDLHLDSFYNFKLNKLKSRWKEIVVLTNENKTNMLESETFLDLIKFLIATLKPKAQLVNVYYKNFKFEYLDSKNKKIKSTMISDGGDELNLITTLIALAPHSINLHCIDQLSNNTFKVLYYIFDKKVNLLV